MKREMHPRWEPIPAVPRTIKGNESKQRPASQHVPELQQPQFDSCYHTHEMARISAEMVRPIITPGTWGGYDVEMMRIASLARFVQIAPAFLRASRGGDARGAVRHLEKRAAASEASTLARARRAGRRAARAMRIPYNRLQRI